MNFNKRKNEILKELPLDGYKEYKRDNKSEKEWYSLCAIVNEMIEDGYVEKYVIPEDNYFEISLTLDGVAFRDNGGYTNQSNNFLKKNIITIISIIVTITGIIIAILFS